MLTVGQLNIRGDTVVQLFVLPPHSWKVVVLVMELGSFCVHVLPVLRGCSPGSPALYPSSKHACEVNWEVWLDPKCVCERVWVVVFYVVLR